MYVNGFVVGPGYAASLSAILFLAGSNQPSQRLEMHLWSSGRPLLGFSSATTTIFGTRGHHSVISALKCRLQGPLNANAAAARGELSAGYASAKPRSSAPVAKLVSNTR